MARRNREASFNGKGNRVFDEFLRESNEKLAAAQAQRQAEAEAAARESQSRGRGGTIDPDAIFTDIPETPPFAPQAGEGRGGEDILRYSMGMAERIATRAIEASYIGRDGGQRSITTGAPSFDAPGRDIARWEAENGRGDYLPPTRQPETIRKRRPLFKIAAGIAVFAATLGGTAAATSKGSEVYCADAKDWFGGTMCFLGARGGEMIPVTRDISSAREWQIFGGEQQSNADNTTGNTPGNTAPDAKPEIPTDGNPEKLTFSELFKEGIPLGSVTAETRIGRAKINYGKESVDLPMISNRTIKLTARPVLEVGKSQDLTPAVPLTVEKQADTVVVTLDRTKITAVVGLEDEGGYQVAGNDTTGYKVTRNSKSGTFGIEFRADAPLKGSHESAGNVNPFAKPSQQNAPVLAQLFDLKHFASTTETMMANKCTNAADGKPLQVTPVIIKKVEQPIEALLQEWAVSNNMRVEFHKKGEYALNAKTVLNQSAKYATVSGNEAARKVAVELASATSDGAKNFTTASEKLTCAADEAFRK